MVDYFSMRNKLCFLESFLLLMSISNKGYQHSILLYTLSKKLMFKFLVEGLTYHKLWPTYGWLTAIS